MTTDSGRNSSQLIAICRAIPYNEHMTTDHKKSEAMQAYEAIQAIRDAVWDAMIAATVAREQAGQ